MKSRLLSFLSLLILLTATHYSFARKAPPPPPAPAYSVPLAVRPGGSVVVSFRGEPVGEPTGLWTLFPCRSTPLTDVVKPDQARYRIITRPDVPIGIYAARLMTSTGVSHLRLLMVDDLKTIGRLNTNSTIAQAQAVTLPVAIEGEAEPSTAHYYRIAAKAGQHLSAEVIAQRVGSAMDPMIRLLDAAGRELLYCDDAPGAGADCRFRYVFPADGDYLIEVRDVNYEGGPSYRYRLRLGDFPLVVCAMPLGGARGELAHFHLLGSGCEQLGDISLALPQDQPRAWLKVKYPDGQGSALASVLCTSMPEVLESGTNDSPPAAMPVNVPTAITGRLLKPRAVHYFEFQGKQNARLLVRGLTRTVGSPAMLALKLLDAEGATLAESDPAAPGDAALSAKLPADGAFRIAASELSGAGGPSMFYRLEIQAAQRGFTLNVDAERENVKPGQSFTIKVTAGRYDYAGPITLSLTGDASTFVLRNNIILPDKKETELEVKVPDDAPPSRQPLSFTVVGHATIKGNEKTETASTCAVLTKTFSRLPYPPIELDGMIGLGIVAPKL